jgi:hypothetical protein
MNCMASPPPFCKPLWPAPTCSSVQPIGREKLP